MQVAFLVRHAGRADAAGIMLEPRGIQWIDIKNTPFAGGINDKKSKGTAVGTAPLLSRCSYYTSENSRLSTVLREKAVYLFGFVKCAKGCFFAEVLFVHFLAEDKCMLHAHISGRRRPPAKRVRLPRTAGKETV